MVQMWSFTTKILCHPEANSEIIIMGFRDLTCQVILGHESQTENTKYFTSIGTLAFNLL